MSPCKSQVDGGLELPPAAARPPRPSHPLQVPGSAPRVAPNAGWKCLSLWTLTHHLRGDLFLDFQKNSRVGTVGARMIDWISANCDRQDDVAKNKNHNVTVFRSAVCQDKVMNWCCLVYLTWIADPSLRWDSKSVCAADLPCCRQTALGAAGLGCKGNILRLPAPPEATAGEGAGISLSSSQTCLGDEDGVMISWQSKYPLATWIYGGVIWDD